MEPHLHASKMNSNPALLLDPTRQRKTGISSFSPSINPATHSAFLFNPSLPIVIQPSNTMERSMLSEGLANTAPLHTWSKPSSIDEASESGHVNQDPVINKALSELPPGNEFAALQPELTQKLTGGDTTHHDNNAATVAQVPRFDHRALLDPRSVNSKRPVSSGEDTERGRDNLSFAGQVGLVERLHNVQGRTSSPAKRIKTEEPRKQTGNGSSFSGGSSLDLHSSGGQRSEPSHGAQIDLTMSKYTQPYHAIVLTLRQVMMTNSRSLVIMATTTSVSARSSIPTSKRTPCPSQIRRSTVSRVGRVGSRFRCAEGEVKSTILPSW